MGKIIKTRKRIENGYYEELLANDSARIYSVERKLGDCEDDPNYEYYLAFAQVIGYKLVTPKEVLSSKCMDEEYQPTKELLTKICDLYGLDSISSFILEKNLKIGLHNVYSIIKWLQNNNAIVKIENSNKYKFIISKEELINKI